MALSMKTVATVCVAALVSATAFAAAADLRLVAAAKNRDVRTVRTLIEQRVDVNTPQPDGATALHWAAQWDDLDMADLLLRSGAMADKADDYGATPLSLACINGSAAMTEKLLAAGANPNAPLPTTGETPLMRAARAGKADAVKALLARGASVDAGEPNQRQTALMWAAAEGHLQVVQTLIQAGADVSRQTKTGTTPLLFAAREGDLETTKALLAAGANINQASSDGTTPLVVATIRGHLSYATFLLDHGANPNIGPGFTPLHWAAGEWPLDYTNDGTRILAEDNEWTPLGGLRGAARLDFVKVLVAHGADVNARATSTPRAYVGLGARGRAAAARSRGSAALRGATPFLLASQAGAVDVMRFLVEKGADPLVKTTNNTTAAMLAAGLGRRIGKFQTTVDESLGALALALTLGNDINAVNNDGETALHGPAYLNRRTVATFLVEKGAMLNQKDKRGWTPLTVAEGNYTGGVYIHSPDVIEVLRKAGAQPSPATIERDATVLATLAGKGEAE
jgi:ankyrin repeat protein